MHQEQKMMRRNNLFLNTEVTLGCQLVKYDLKVKATKSNNRFEPVTFLYSSFYLFCGMKIITRVNVVFITILPYICHGNIKNF